jgi:hypothetical protein
MKSPVAIRYFSLSPAGDLLRLSLVFVQWVHHRPRRVWATSFADRTMRLVECVLKMDEGKVTGIHGMGFSLIRFDGAGRPDMKRYWKEVYATMPDLLDPNPGEVLQEGNVLHMEQTFVGNGGKSVPTLAGRMLLERAALGQIRLPELDHGWRRSRVMSLADMK